MMPDDGFVRNNGICKTEKCFEMPIMQLENSYLLAMQIYNEDAEGRDFINAGFMCPELDIIRD